MLRHLTGLCLAVVMFLVMFFAGTWGYVRLLRLPAAASAPLSGLPAQGGSLLGNTSVLAAMGAVAVTGLLAGYLVASPRISPLAAGLPGLVALAWEALYLGNVHQAVRLIPFQTQAFGSGWEAMLFNGILGAAGLAMAAPLLVPSRWRGRGARSRDDEFADLSDTQSFVADLKESMASASPPRPPALPAGRTTGGMPRVGAAPARTTGGMPRATGGMPRTTGGMPRVAQGEVTGSVTTPTRSTGGMPRAAGATGRPSRTGLVGGGPAPASGGGRPRPRSGRYRPARDE